MGRYRQNFVAEMKDLTHELIFSKMNVDTGTKQAATGVVLSPRAPSFQIQNLLAKSHMHFRNNVLLKEDGTRCVSIVVF